MRVTIASTILLWAVAALPAGGASTGTPSPESEAEKSGVKPLAEDPAKVPAAAENEPELKPRLELRMNSIDRFLDEVHRSNAGMFVEFTHQLLLEMARSSAEGISAEELLGVVAAVGQWPDSSAEFFVFAPDREGRPRWALRLDWPVADLNQRVESLLSTDAAKEMLAGLEIHSGSGGVRELRLDTDPLAFMKADGNRAVVVSHADLRVPGQVSFASAKKDGDEAEEDEPKKTGPILACRLTLTGTEQDSGATMLSSFQAITGVDYLVYVDESGEFVEQTNIYWPPIAGLGAKVLLDRIKQTFFAPRESFATMAFNASASPTMVEEAAGLGTQIIMVEPGQMEAAGDLAMGPLRSALDSAMTLTILPGTGLFPAPDFVVQARVDDADAVIEDIRSRMEEINDLYRERDLDAPWREEEVRDRPVFWSKGGGPNQGTLLPFVLRPVMFTTTETDADGEEHSFLVAAWTSTAPANMVRRWVDLPRTKDYLHLPTERKSSGQLWINWKLVYRWVQPYLDMFISGASLHTLTPDREKAEQHLSDGVLTARTTYGSLKLSHRGPLPLGVIAVPAMLAASGAMESGGSDLARERLACQRLKVLYHHSKLFRQDFNRWPAAVSELDGYIDFAGNPQLLELDLSSRKRWDEWFSTLFSADEEEEQESGDGSPAVKDDLFTIDWGSQTWTLGYVPGTLDHLERLYIDQDGVIHRMVKRASADGESAGGL